MTDVRITHVGGPTTLIEVDGLRLLTDPTFDPPGRRYTFGWGSASRKNTGPALAAGDLPPIDAVLLTHDQHGDNLDTAGRALLPTARVVLTTRAAARRLGGNAVGLAPWQTATIGYDDGRLLVTATPARHGPPLSRAITGAVTGFALRRPDHPDAFWITGDTVLHGGLRRVADRLVVRTALLHLGAVRFGVTGPVRYSLNAREAVELCRLLRPRTVLPVHYEGWGHFQEGREPVERAFAAAPEQVRSALRWLPIGTPVTLPDAL
ncbi:MBL fold metallo-hydrolase [Micromonospora sp. NPDC049366]|uniref:MBL fold metallo-hydrolase n=1 Tax=Micromonospora sp. NPDC049366 TaxID=3364271 RepID=UPI0037A27518